MMLLEWKSNGTTMEQPWFPVDFPNQSNDVHEDVHDSLLTCFHYLDLFGFV